MTPAISIIIPTYNRLELLKETLQSIFQQTLQASEIIVVDNGSSDGTVEWLKRTHLDKVIVIQNTMNTPGAARNKGLEAATGDYIKFFDSDDLMTNNTLEVQANALDQSDKGFIYGPYFYAKRNELRQWQQTDPAILNYYPFSCSKPLHYWMAVKNLFITIPGMLFKKELLNEAGPWRKDVVASEDWDYLWRLSLLEPFPAHSNECAFLYRVHGRQTMEDNFDHDQRDKDKVRVLEDILRSNGHDEKVSKKEVNYLNNKLYQVFRVNNERADSAAGQIVKCDTWYNRLLWQKIRFEQKLGRMKTKTNWQPCHGPNSEKSIFKNYMKMINSND
jgi:glycosyltransferase involved in cell wall biosynthesis